MNNYIWLNNVHSAMIHPRISNRNGQPHEFSSLSFGCDKSVNGIANVSLNNAQIREATHRDGTINANYRNILIGKAGQKKQISILSKKGYKKIEVTCEEILESFNSAREKYKATHTA